MITASLLATSMAIGACGDDDGGGGDDEPREDAGGGGGGGGGGNDAAVDAARPDASVPDSSIPGGDAGGDAGNQALLAAADPSGVKVDMARVTLLFTATCERAKDCQDPLWTETCVPESLASYDFGVQEDYSEACRDALLDRIGCYATQATCDLFFDSEDCLPLETAYNAACAEYMNADDDAGT